jgi:Mg2+ and Co2+ transporter CorA
MELVAEKLDKINKTLENIYSVLNRPENKVTKILTLMGTGVGALGFLHLIDLIRNWIIGG